MLARTSFSGWAVASLASFAPCHFYCGRQEQASCYPTDPRCNLPLEATPFCNPCCSGCRLETNPWELQWRKIHRPLSLTLLRSALHTLIQTRGPPQIQILLHQHFLQQKNPQCLLPHRLHFLWTLTALFLILHYHLQSWFHWWAFCSRLLLASGVK